MFDHRMESRLFPWLLAIGVLVTTAPFLALDIAASPAAAAGLSPVKIANPLGDGPDNVGSTADDTWQFWFEYDTHTGYGRLAVYYYYPVWVANSSTTEGWVYSATEDWDPRYEGVWGNTTYNEMYAHPYTHHGLHASVAITYKVPATDVYNISASATDTNVISDGPGGTYDGITLRIYKTASGSTYGSLVGSLLMGDDEGRMEDPAGSERAMSREEREAQLAAEQSAEQDAEVYADEERQQLEDSPVD